VAVIKESVTVAKGRSRRSYAAHPSRPTVGKRMSATGSSTLYRPKPRKSTVVVYA
jgi:hypothetical protein